MNRPASGSNAPGCSNAKRARSQPGGCAPWGLAQGSGACGALPNGELYERFPGALHGEGYAYGCANVLIGATFGTARRGTRGSISSSSPSAALPRMPSGRSAWLSSLGTRRGRSIGPMGPGAARVGLRVPGAPGAPAGRRGSDRP